MPDLIVRLSNNDDHNETFDLNYNFLDNPFVSKWIDRYRFSQSRGDDISTRDQFYGINNEWTPEKTMYVINDSIDKINKMVPGLILRISSTAESEFVNLVKTVATNIFQSWSPVELRSSPVADHQDMMMNLKHLA